MHAQPLHKLGLLSIVVLVGAACAAPAPAAAPTAGQPAASAQPAAAVEDVVVGVVLPLSGTWAFEGKTTLSGYEMAADEINAKGGIKSLGGAKIKLATEDAGATAADAASATERLISKNLGKLSALSGAWLSGFTLTATEVSERAQIPWVTHSWSQQITGRGFKYVFRYSYDAAQIGTSSLNQVLDLAKAQGGGVIKSLGLLVDDTPSVQGFANQIRPLAKERGISIALDEQWSPPLADASPLIAKARAAKPDLLFIGYTSGTDGVLLVRKMREQSLTLPTVQVGSAALSAGFRQTMGDLADGLIATTHYNIMKGQQWLKDMYTKRTGSAFFPNDVGSGYGMLWTIKEALEKAGSRDPKAVRDALSGLDVTSGPAAEVQYGRVKFDANGNLIGGGGTLVVQWQKGDLMTIWPAEVATAQPIWPKR